MASGIEYIKLTDDYHVYTMKPEDKEHRKDEVQQGGKTRSAAEAWLEPLPVPEAVESNTETAWGRWEDSLLPQPEPEPDPKIEPNPDFEDTVPVSDLILADLERLRKR